MFHEAWAASRAMRSRNDFVDSAHPRHNASDGVHLCHSSCSLLDGGPMADYLSSVNTWVQSNPNEGE